MEYVRSQLSKHLNFIYFSQIPQKRLQVYLTDNYLEIDIGYGAYTGAAAIRKHWKVLFDKSGTVDKAMRASWEKKEAASKTNELNKKLAECSDSVWHNLMLAAVAIKRRQYWRAYTELDLARKWLIECFAAGTPLMPVRTEKWINSLKLNWPSSKKRLLLI